MAEKENKKHSFSIYSLFGKIADILFIPIIVISLFSSMSMLIQKKQHKPTSIFGYSLVNILSDSMTPSGFKKGDTVLTKSANVATIELGDIIAFYNYRDSLDSTTQKHIVARYNYTEGELKVEFSDSNIERGIAIDTFEHVERENEKNIADAQKAKARIYFHQVIGMYLDENGNVFYKTKGSKNTHSDDYIRSDFVVGEYVHTPRVLRDAMSFCSSSMGMIVLVCLPLSILVLMQCFSLIKQIEVMSIEKQLILGKKRYDDNDIQENFNGNEIEDYNKALLYYLTAPTEREQLTDFMWGDLIGKNKRSKKEQKLFETLQSANVKLDTSDKDYWNEWIDNSRGYTKKKLKKYYEDLAVSNVFNSNKTEAAAKNSKKQEVVNEKVEVKLNETSMQNSLSETIARAEANTRARAIENTSTKKATKQEQIKSKAAVVKKETTQAKANITPEKKIAPSTAVDKQTTKTAAGENKTVKKVPGKSSSSAQSKPVKKAPVKTSSNSISASNTEKTKAVKKATTSADTKTTNVVSASKMRPAKSARADVKNTAVKRTTAKTVKSVPKKVGK